MKKLLAAAVATALVGPVVADSSDVVIYGKIHMLLTRDKIDFPVDPNDPLAGKFEEKNWKVTPSTSRLGFKGTEDLGNGLKAIWKYEMTYAGLDACNGSGGGPVCSGPAITSARNSYVGLAGDWGTFLIGRHDTPYKVAWYAMGLDFLDESILDLNNVGPYSGVTGIKAFSEFRLDNTITYISPSFSGFTIAGAIVPGENAGPGAFDNDSLADHYSIGGMFNANGIKVSAGYEMKDFKNTTPNDGLTKDKLWFVGGSYTINGFTGGAAYEENKDVFGEKGDKKKAWALALKYAFGNNAIVGNYTDGKFEQDGVKDVDFDDYGLAFEHNFSKRTKAYVAYNRAKVKDFIVQDLKATQYGLGIIHLF
jgi:predicted porin